MAKLENLFWKSEASFPAFEKYLTRLNEAFIEMEDAEQPLFPAQKVQWLIRGVKNDGIQVQTTIGSIRDRYLTNFDVACLLTLSRTISSRFASIEPGKNKRSIGAVGTNPGRSGNRGCGRGRGRYGGQGGATRVVMNGVDVTRKFTSAVLMSGTKCTDAADIPLCTRGVIFLAAAVAGEAVAIVAVVAAMEGELLMPAVTMINPRSENRNVAAVNVNRPTSKNAVTEIVEYDASTSTIAS